MQDLMRNWFPEYPHRITMVGKSTEHLVQQFSTDLKTNLNRTTNQIYGSFLSGLSLLSSQCRTVQHKVHAQLVLSFGVHHESSSLQHRLATSSCNHLGFTNENMFIGSN